MNKALAVGLGLIITLLFFYPGKFDFLKRSEPVKNNKVVEEVPSVGMNEEYAAYEQTFKTYKSKFGFVFKYPPHLKLLEDPIAYIDQRLFLAPTGYDGG